VILSNVDIQDALEKGLLVISPQPGPTRPVEGLDCPYQTSSVDLRLGHELSKLKEGRSISFDLTSGSLKGTLADNCERITFAKDTPYVLPPGQFVLGKTLERIELPISEDGPWLAARVEGAKLLCAMRTVGTFYGTNDPRWLSGTITLEIMNFGDCSIILHPETPICQLVLEQVTSKPFRNDSQFHGQTEATGVRNT
jgi:deoxycytidine triphosphate deaminase